MRKRAAATKKQARRGTDGVELAPLRPPAVPLVTHDPYFSVWSFADRLNDEWPRHWTGAGQGTCGLVRVDGKAASYCGRPQGVEAARQTEVTVLPTRTIYRFETGGVELILTFLTPALTGDLEVLSRPLTYVAWQVRSLDGAEHQVQVYLETSGDWTVDHADQPVEWGRYRLDGLNVLRIGSAEQKVLSRSGDNLRIEWGHLYQAAVAQPGLSSAMGDAVELRQRFQQRGALEMDDDLRMPRRVSDGWPALATSFDLGAVGRATQSRWAMLAYDDRESIEYLNRRLRPYWRRNGADAGDLLRAAAKDYVALSRRCKAFDEQLMEDLRRAGGEKYARLCALAYRQCLAAHKLAADADGTAMYFSKENFSNGCIDTVDVTYPSAPFFLLLCPALLKAQLTPLLRYAQMPRWPFPFAPHDLGQYPLANGQVYGGGEKSEANQMPVEESGNILLLMAALAKVEGNAEYAAEYWPLLSTWAQYLLSKGYNPANQLCTDDFAGHLAGNTNLSLKAILALGGYAMLCRMRGQTKEAQRYRAAAEKSAKRWLVDADDGDHTRLAFDRPGTWSLKYNLVWDKLLGLKLFPSALAEREVAFYKTKLTRFGPPLDNRHGYTKLDWVMWAATLAGKQADFELFADALYAWADQSPSRVPLSDWYETGDGKHLYFQARSVVGGLFIKLLAERGARK